MTPIASVLCLRSGLAPWCPSELLSFFFHCSPPRGLRSSDFTCSFWCPCESCGNVILLWSILSTCPIRLHLQLCRTTSLHLCVCPQSLAIHHWRWCMASVPCKSCGDTWIGTHLFSCCLLSSFSTSGCRTVPLAGPVRWTALFSSSWSIRKSSVFYSIFKMFVFLQTSYPFSYP